MKRIKFKEIYDHEFFTDTIKKFTIIKCTQINFKINCTTMKSMVMKFAKKSLEMNIWPWIIKKFTIIKNALRRKSSRRNL